jgi:hypothetical protein
MGQAGPQRGHVRRHILGEGPNDHIHAQGARIEWETLNREVIELCRAGRSHRAVGVAQTALEVAETNAGQKHPAGATSLNNLAALDHLLRPSVPCPRIQFCTSRPDLSVAPTWEADAAPPRESIWIGAVGAGRPLQPGRGALPLHIALSRSVGGRSGGSVDTVRFHGENVVRMSSRGASSSPQAAEFGHGGGDARCEPGCSAPTVTRAGSATSLLEVAGVRRRRDGGLASLREAPRIEAARLGAKAAGAGAIPECADVRDRRRRAAGAMVGSGPPGPRGGSI